MLKTTRLRASRSGVANYWVTSKYFGDVDNHKTLRKNYEVLAPWN